MNSDIKLSDFMKTVGLFFWMLVFGLGVNLCDTYANNGTCGDNLTWSFSNGVLEIDGTGEMRNYNEEQLPPWNKYSSEIKEIIFPDGLTSVGDWSFINCDNLTKVKFPSSVNDIGDYAFFNCEALAIVDLNEGIKIIGESAFQECLKLTNINFSKSMASIKRKAFYRCESLYAVNIPSSVEYIGDSVFAYCYKLMRVTINAPLTSLPSWMFYGCYNLTDVSLAPSISVANEYAFQGCENLNTIYTQSENVDIAYQLEQSIIKNNDTNLAGRVAIYDIPESSVNTSVEGEVTTQITVTDTGDAVISFENTSDMTEDKTVNDFTINATVDNNKGWEDLANTTITAEETKPDDIDKVNVNVQLNGSTVDDSDISKLAGLDVILNITTDNGTEWKVDMSQVSEDSLKGSYDLNVSLEKVDSEKVDIDSETIYSTKFSSTTKFNTSVGIDVDNAYQLATLYQKKGGSYEALQTVVVDENGKAWFNVASIDKDTDYYIGINAEGVTTEEAVIPESLYGQYGIDEVSYLTDDQGTRYELTGRYSKWGITGKQFAIYVGIAVGLIVIIVTVVMITLNKMNKSKAKYMRHTEDVEDEPIDEEAMRLQIMKEMLEEQKKGSKKTDK